jgi:hypothetical protein
MQWEFIVAIIIAIPLILFPAAFIWYLNVGGIYQAVKRLVARRAAREPEQAAKTAPESNRTGG